MRAGELIFTCPRVQAFGRGIGAGVDDTNRKPCTASLRR
jgi:hypothetical protein